MTFPDLSMECYSSPSHVSRPLDMLHCVQIIKVISRKVNSFLPKTFKTPNYTRISLMTGVQ